MPEQVRIALIGFGGMGQIYAKMIHAGLVPGMVLTGVCCRNAAGQTQLKDQFPGVSLYRNTDDAAAHAGEFDAVLIVTPHTSHISIGMQMAKLGKHILMDKPAGIAAGEVRSLVQYCEQNGLAFGRLIVKSSWTLE